MKREVNVLRLVCEPETEPVLVLEFDRLTVPVGDADVVLERLAEPVVVAVCTWVLEGTGGRVPDGDMVGLEVAVMKEVGSGDRVSDPVAALVPVGGDVGWEDRLVVHVARGVRAWTGVVLAERQVVEDLVAGRDRVIVRVAGSAVAVIRMEAEDVTETVEVLLPGPLRLGVRCADVLLLIIEVRVAVLETVEEAVHVEDPDAVHVALIDSVGFTVAVAVFELETDPVAVAVCWIVCVVRVDLEADEDAVEVFEIWVDRVVETETVEVRDGAADRVVVGQAV